MSDIPLVRLQENVCYFPCPHNIGVITNGSKAVLIDSGLDKGQAGKLLKALQQANLQPVAVINTHAHADHCGGNAYLQQQAGVRVYAPEIEAGLIEAPYLEPVYLSGGASPLPELQNKFLMAAPSRVDLVIDSGQQQLDIAGLKLKVVSLPGHSYNQIGVAYDGVLFCGDALFSLDVLKKHKLPFLTSVADQIETLHGLSDHGFELLVPYHAAPAKSFGQEITLYLQILDQVEEQIVGLLKAPRMTEEVAALIYDQQGIMIGSLQQHYLLRAVVTAFLNHLHEQGRIGCLLENNRLLWQVR